MDALSWQALLSMAVLFALLSTLIFTRAPGAAGFLADSMIGLAGPEPAVQLAMLYLLTMLLTEILSNTTAVVLAFPIALATASDLSVNPLPFVVAITIAASCGFATPVGYQTNLMVYGPGGYRFSDFLRLGGALNLVVAAVAIALAPIMFPF